MNPRWRLILTSIAFVAAASPAGADNLGDPAPALQIAEWIKGDPVVLGDEKGADLHVIEFWAAAIPECRERIPRLTEMQQKYREKNVVFVAVTPEKPETVRKFVELAGPKIGYRVAVDEKSATVKAYAKGYFFKTVPRVFVVGKEGKVLWLGFDLDVLGKTLDSILAGTYDLEGARRIEQARRGMTVYFQMVKSITKAEQAAPIGEKVLEFGKRDMQMLNAFAWGIATEPGLFKRDLDLARRAAQMAYDACDGKDPAIVDTYARVLWETGKKKEALEYQKKAVKLAEEQQATPALQQELKTTLEKYLKVVEGE